MIIKRRTRCRSLLFLLGLCFLAACGGSRQEDNGHPDTEEAAVIREQGADEKNAVFETEGDESEEETGEEEKDTRLLIVMDVSGSTDRAVSAIENMTATTLALAAEAPNLLSVEYMGFHTEVVGPYFEMTEELSVRSNAETSVYAGFFGIDRWITNHIGESGETLAVIVFSDLFSSRNRDGKRYQGLEEAQREQEQMNEWLNRWQELVEQGELRICFVRYESTCPYEESSATLENRQTVEELRYGFQVMLEETIGEQRFLGAGDIGIGENIRDCLGMILRTISGKKCRSWKSGGTTRRGIRKAISIKENIWTLVIVENAGGRVRMRFNGESEDAWNDIGEEQCVHISNDFYLLSFLEDARTMVEIEATDGRSDIYYLQVK